MIENKRAPWWRWYGSPRWWRYKFSMLAWKLGGRRRYNRRHRNG
jgi:hypothetical protein